MNKKLLLILAIFFLMSLSFLAGIYFVKNPITFKLPPSKKEKVVIKPGFLTYENIEFGFSFDYPDGFEVMENETSATMYVNINDGYELLTFEIVRQNEETFYSSQPTTKVSTFNGVDWNFHEATEYCDGDQCNQTNPGYTTRKGDMLFTLVISGPNTDLQTADQILSTFRFL